MILRRLRIPLLFAALWITGYSACLAHGGPTGSAQFIESAARSRAPSEQSPAALAVGLTLAGLAGSLLARRGLRRRNPMPGNLPRGLTAVTAGALLAVSVWVLPWLSFHETHHALDADEPTCTVAQIVHSQAGGIVPALPALDLPPAVATVPLPDPIVLSARIAPEPAARSPPA